MLEVTQTMRWPLGRERDERVRGVRLGVSTPWLLALTCLLLLGLAAPAPAACEIDPGNDDPGACGAFNPDPPPTTPEGPLPLVAWASGYDLNPFNGDRTGIWIARIDGTQRRKVVTSERINKDFEPHGLNLPDDHPSFSPDSRRIAFTSNRHNRADWDIHVMNANGTGVARLAAAPGLDTEPVFSPDGRKIAFATERFGNGLDIAVMDSNGTNVRRVTTAISADLEPAWRPDGQEIAFSRLFAASENKDIFAIKPDGTGERRITNIEGEDHDPTYSPSGQHLVITSERPTFSPPYGNVYRLNASDGASLGDLTRDLEFGAGDPFWSRDGRHIAFFTSSTRFLNSPQRLYVMNADGTGKFHIPGEALANIHPAMGLPVDDDQDGTPNYLESGSVGRAALSPRRVRAGRTVLLRFDWKHPRRWRQLDTMWLRLSQRRWLRGMVRFSMRHRAFSLFDGVTDTYGPARRRGRGRLRSRLLSLDLRRTRIVNLSKRKIRLTLAVRFPHRMAGQRLRVRVQANDRRGRSQEEWLGRLRVVR